MYLCIYAIVGKELAQYLRIRCRNPLTVEIFQTGIYLCLGDGKGETAASESQFLKHIHFKSLFCNLIISYDSYVRSTDRHSLRYIIIAEKNYLCRKICSAHQKLALFLTYCHTRFLKKFHTLLIQASLCLYGYPQHYILTHIPKNKKPAPKEAGHIKLYIHTALPFDIHESNKMVMMQNTHSQNPLTPTNLVIQINKAICQGQT